MGDDAFLVRFGRTRHGAVALPRGASLAEHLTVDNSPLLFGCRTGICGTCVVRVRVLGTTPLAPPGDEEAELLQIICPGEPQARLACQLRLTTDIDVAPLGAGALR
jgi:ferredoxin